MRKPSGDAEIGTIHFGALDIDYLDDEDLVAWTEEQESCGSDLLDGKGQLAAGDVF